MVGMCGDYPMYMEIPNGEHVIVRTGGGNWRCIRPSEDISTCYSLFYAQSTEVRESVEGWWEKTNIGLVESYATCQ